MSVCSTVACWFYNTCNILKWDLMGLVFVFKVDTSNSTVSWSLMKSHWFSWFNGCQSQELRCGKAIWISQRQIRATCLGTSLGLKLLKFCHPRHGSQYVTVWSCAVPMWRLYAIVLSEMRTRMEWASDEYCKCIATALKTWTSAGGYSLWPSLEAWQSKEIMVSNGFCFGWFWHVLAVFAFVGTVEFGVACDGFGRLSFFVLQWWEEIWRGPGGFALCSVCLLQKCRGELQAVAMPICIAGPKVGGVSGPTNCTCFLPQKGEGFVMLIFHSSFATRLCLCSRVVIVTILYYSSILVLWGSCRYRLPSFLTCFDAWEMWSVAYALRIYGSLCPEVPAVYTSFQAWSWGNFLPWRNQFEANQILKRIAKSHGRAKPWKGMMCENTEVRILVE